jgi:hypothetical protein
LPEARSRSSWITGVDAKEAGKRRHRLAAGVHVGERLDEQHLLPHAGLCDHAAAGERPHLHPVERDPLFLPQQFDALKANVVPVAAVLRARIAQPDDHLEFGHALHTLRRTRKTGASSP